MFSFVQIDYEFPRVHESRIALSIPASLLLPRKESRDQKRKFRKTSKPLSRLSLNLFFCVRRVFRRLGISKERNKQTNTYLWQLSDVRRSAWSAMWFSEIMHFPGSRRIVRKGVEYNITVIFVAFNDHTISYTDDITNLFWSLSLGNS